ncbi:ras-related protein RabC-like isoform X1 [Pomacea canaliculata]|uniref:ras-related protein RabC-like isoform X1 n=1 Tax=Pomacea canaliculata TaxID=400727 RepID=UPI000D72C296|nr:ras-related protein RabC-like isoform X1 [Pomacea canaliculata]
MAKAGQQNGRTAEVKVALVGDKHVGKTSLLTRFLRGTFSQHYHHTRGGDIEYMDFPLNGTTIRVKLIDSAGHRRVRSLIKSLYRDAHALLVVFDVTREKTLESVPDWIQEINQVNTSNPVIFLVGSKQDLTPYRTVQPERAQQMSDLTKLPYYETSSRTGHNVSRAFTDLIRLTYHNLTMKGGDKLDDGFADSVRLLGKVKGEEHRQMLLYELTGCYLSMEYVT